MSNYSPAPGTPQTAYKAYFAAASSFVAAFAVFWIADVDPFTKKEMAEAALAGAVAAGLIGGGTGFVKNAPK